MPKKKLLTTFNAFTKSYQLRYVVHGAHTGSDKTICGRAIYKPSKDKFDENATGSCIQARLDG